MSHRRYEGGRRNFHELPVRGEVRRPGHVFHLLGALGAVVLVNGVGAGEHNQTIERAVETGQDGGAHLEKRGGGARQRRDKEDRRGEKGGEEDWKSEFKKKRENRIE